MRCQVFVTFRFIIVKKAKSCYSNHNVMGILTRGTAERISDFIIGFCLNVSDQSLAIDVTTPLKAEEDDFSLEGLDDSYLMDVRKTAIGDEDDGGGVSHGGGSGAVGGASGGAAAHSPLR